jgi:hypothetical protein
VEKLIVDIVRPQFQYFLTASSTRLWKLRRKCPRYEHHRTSYVRANTFNVSVRFWPSCVEGMQLLGALRFCRRVNLVGENVVGVSPGDGEIQAGQQLCQRFTFSAFQHRQCVSPLVSHGDTFREWRNDSDADSALCDCLFDVWEV